MPSRPTSLAIFGPLLTDGREYPDCLVHIEGDRIAEVRPNAVPGGADVVLREGWLIPGLVDLQVNGAGGVDLATAPEPTAALAQVARTLARHGTTSFCPTLISSPPAETLRMLPPYGPARPEGGAESLGVHLEGPFLSPSYRGVHEESALRLPEAAELEAWLQTGAPRLVTLAPELPGALEAIRRLAAAGVTVGLGHSGADEATARQALAAGARLGTHLFNAMAPLNHRQPGLAGALLASTAYLGLIADGVHVHPLMIELVVRLAGPRRVALVSDALAAAGAGPGESRLGEQVVVSDGQAVWRPDGVLAGSATLLDGALRNLRTWLPHLAPAKAVQMATQTPAAALGRRVAARKGRVAPGYDADLAILDGNWRVVATVLRGELTVFEPSDLPMV
ncbi:MAG: N-acetylglucosamine-6-phosphate deacetylase [Chloroflexota bacterium]